MTETGHQLVVIDRPYPGETDVTQTATIQQLSAPDLKAMIDSGAVFEFVDVRTPGERAVARIEGSRLLDQAYHDYLLGLDRDTTLVFQCHHGMRSQAAAEYCLGHGFRNLYNLSGGIDAWSQLVDSSVPRY
jgi:monothiol glutaredoxin